MGKRKQQTYIVVHRNAAGEVMQCSETFTDESEGGPFAARLLTHINFFAGDSLVCEDEDGQAKEAHNA